MVVERSAGPDTWEATGGPFSRYERTLRPRADGTIDEAIDCALAVPFWWILFWLPMRHALRHRPAPGRRPWWAPADPLDARAATVLGLLASLALVEGYVASLLIQTITFAAQELDADRGDQGIALAIVRGGVVVAIVVSARADRVGRRRLLAVATACGCISAAAGALAPNLAVLTATQLVATGCVGATALLIGITSAEEMPAGSRAYGYSLITMAGGLGAGVCVWVLPAADIDQRAWRVIYLVPLAGLAVVAAVARRLPESRRFARAHVEVSIAGHGRRLTLLAGAAFLGAIFVAPAYQLQNDFLREQQGFSAARISLFTVVTGTPAALGIVLGGRLADVRGRRVVGAVGLVGGAAGIVAGYASTGWPLWAWTTLGAVFAGLVVPALGVYRPELFPTGLRGRASGIIQGVALAGSATGLVVVGHLVDRQGDYFRPMALVALGPLAAAIVVLAAFPETARRELEELNPEDAPLVAARSSE
ncbi:MAG: MFS transporter [Acidimicrobiales bacterium]